MEAVTDIVGMLQKVLTGGGAIMAAFGGLGIYQGVNDSNGPELKKGIGLLGAGIMLILIGMTIIPKIPSYFGI